MRGLAKCSLLLPMFVFVTLLIGATRSGDVDRWHDRLESLHPDRPLEYFLLAEEVSDAAADDDDSALARRLFGLAGVLDQNRLGRSACLALADMEQRPHLRRRLRALAVLIGERSGQVMDGDIDAFTTAREASAGTVETLLEAFSAYRRGYGQRALKLLRDPEVRDLMEANDRLIPGGVNGFLEDCKLYRSGNRTPQVYGDDQTRMLRLEAALLSGDTRPFSADLLINRGNPLIEIDPDRLEDTLGVDASRPVFRHGRWVESE